MATGADNLLDRILSVRRSAVLLRGPARSGKTTAALALYRRLADQGNARCLLIAPNYPCVSWFRRELLRTSPGGVLLGPQIVTFSGLAGRILAQARFRMISPLHRQLLLRRIIDDLLAAGKLRALEPVASTLGLAATIDRAIAELKRSAVEPEDLAGALGAPSSGQAPPGKSADLLEIYRRYQQHLHEHGLFDVEGQMWLARDALEHSPGGETVKGLEGNAALAVDGFADFTPTQLKMLALLHERLATVLITLPHDQDNRARMWRWTDRTLCALREAFGTRLVEIAMDSQPSRSPGGLGPLVCGVLDVEAPPIAPPEGLRIIEAAGIEAEVSAVARRVKKLLMSGAPGRIAVLARSLEVYRRPIERIFARFGIPIASGPSDLTELGPVRFLLEAAALAPEFGFGGVLGVVRSSYFRPSALGPFDERTVAAAEMLIRQGNVLSGRESYGHAAGRMIARAMARAGESADQEDSAVPELSLSSARAEDIEAAWAMLQKLFDLCASAGDPKGLLELMRALQTPQAAMEGRSDRLIARDLRALGALEKALGELAREQEAQGPAPATPWPQLRQALACVRVGGDRGENLLDVLDVLDARAIRYDHVFVLGLGEGSFPQRLGEGSLLGEADRQAWARRGVVLDFRRDLRAREMLLFYLALSRAERSLTLSCLASDASGKPRAPSAFLLSVMDLCGGRARLVEAGLLEQIEAGPSFPPPADVASEQEAFITALAGLFRPDQAASSPSRAAGKSTDAVLPPHKLLCAAGGLLARHRRWRLGPCDEFDGRLSDPALMADLYSRFPGQTVFSASQLNAFGQCPWQFFATHVLRLTPIVRPERSLEAVSAGIFCHDVLWRVMTGLRGGSQAFALRDVPEDRLLKALEDAIEAASAAVEARRPPYPVLWAIQRRQMHLVLKEYLLTQRQDQDLDAQSLHFELGFGLDRPGRRGGPEEPGMDPLSRLEPISLQTGAGPIRLRGKIDRVDLVAWEGAAGLLVVDYKTGRLPSDNDMTTGRNLQLPLYSAAAQQILGRPSVGGVFHRVSTEVKMRFFAAFRRRGSKYSACPEHTERQQAAMELVGQFVQRMQQGQFDALPTHQCPSYCPLRQICHFSEARALRKAPPQDQTPGAEAKEDEA